MRGVDGAREVTCANCGAANPAGQRFCGNCGHPLAVACGTCGADNPASNRFCGTCGSALGQQGPGERQVAAGHLPGQRDERRLVTVLFADVSGFTAMSEQMDHEEVKNLADRCAELMGDQVARFGGRVLSVMGDAVMAVFGAPVAHDDDPERAVRAALAMIASVTAGSQGALSLHAGINTGEVLAGLLGPADRRDYTVMGDTVNTAARLMSAAHGGQVMVGRATFEATARTIRYEQRDSYAAKGKRDLVEVWEAMAPLPRRIERVTPGTALVGRERELGLLDETWRAALFERGTQLVTVLGPPGLGKSRLAREFSARVEEGGSRVLWGASLAYGEGTGFGAFAEQVRQAAGIDPGLAPEQATPLLATHLAAVFGTDQADVRTNFELILGYQHADAPPDREGLFLSVRRYLGALARQQPTMLVFEDIHWADATLVDLVSSLAARSGPVPLLIFCLARPELLETHPQWGAGQPAHTSLTLEPLEAAPARRLARALLGDAVGANVDRLVTAAGGNPLFLEELAATVSTHGASAAELPTSITAIIGARLDTLPPADRDILQVAATVGDVFWRGAVAALVGRDNGVDQGLDELEARGFIRRSPDSRLVGDAEFVFKHALIREVAYARVPRATRKLQHGDVAHFLETALGDRAVEQAPLLAHHLLLADESRRAVEYLVIAADRASRAWAKSEAIALYTQAIDLLGEGPDARQRVAQLRFSRAGALNGIGDLTGADSDLGEALGVLEGDDRARALVDRSRLAFARVDADDIVTYADLAEAAADELGLPLYKAQALVARSQADLMQAELDTAISVVTRGVELWPEESRNTAPYAEAIGHVGLFHYWRGDFGETLEAARRAVDVALEQQSLLPSIQGMAHVGLALTGMGRHSEALPWFERSVNLGREWETVPRFTSRSVAMWSGTIRELMDPAEARRFSERALEMGRQSAFGASIGSSTLDLALLDLGDGNLGSVEAAVPKVAEMAVQIKGFHKWLFEVRLAHLIAELSLAQGRGDVAAEAARRAVEKADGLSRRKYAAMSRTTLARALLATGKPVEATAVAREAASLAAAVGHPHTLWRATAALAAAAAAAGDDDGAGIAASTAAETVMGFASGLPAEHRERVRGAEETAAILASAGRAPAAG
jgi:class 3 adenylate cyclase/tetratricopeptide (TPR) repeat protein